MPAVSMIYSVHWWPKLTSWPFSACLPPGWAESITEELRRCWRPFSGKQKFLEKRRAPFLTIVITQKVTNNKWFSSKYLYIRFILSHSNSNNNTNSLFAFALPIEKCMLLSWHILLTAFSFLIFTYDKTILSVLLKILGSECCLPQYPLLYFQLYKKTPLRLFTAAFFYTF